MNIELSDDLIKQLEAHVEQSNDFETVSDYAEYVLAEVLKQTQDDADESIDDTDSSSDSGDSADYTEQQEEQVKKRLQDLGYLD